MERFLFFFICKLLTHVCFHISISVTSSNTDRLQIFCEERKHQPRAYYRSTSRESSIKKDYTNCFSKQLTATTSSSKTAMICHRLLWKTGCDTQCKSPEEQKSAKCSHAACLDRRGSGTNADADLPGEANPAPPKPKQDKAKKKCSRKRQGT